MMFLLFVAALIAIVAIGVALNMGVTWLLQYALWGVFGIAVQFWPLFACVLVFNYVVYSIKRQYQARND